MAAKEIEHAMEREKLGGPQKTKQGARIEEGGTVKGV